MYVLNKVYRKYSSVSQTGNLRGLSSDVSMMNSVVAIESQCPLYVLSGFLAASLFPDSNLRNPLETGRLPGCWNPWNFMALVSTVGSSTYLLLHARTARSVNSRDSVLKYISKLKFY